MASSLLASPVGRSTMEDESRPKRWRRQLGLQDSVDSEAYAKLMQKYPFPKVENETDTNSNDSIPTNGVLSQESSDSLDPLSAMVAENLQEAERQAQMEAEYRRATLHKQTMSRPPESEDYDERLIDWQIIQRDLHRLSGADRHSTQLQRILWIYTNSNPLTYQQGMHEVSHYVLEAVGDGDEAQAYELFVAIMASIPQCYDFETKDTSAQKSSFEQPLQACSRRVLMKLQSYCDKLTHRLEGIGVPPQLYLTKWMRLLFSREVKEVLPVWDVLFGLGVPLQVALEAAAVARLLWWRSQLMTETDIMSLVMNLPTQPNNEWMNWIAPVARNQPLSLPPLPSPAPVLAPTGNSTPQSTRMSVPAAESQETSNNNLFSFSSLKTKLQEATQQAKETTQILGLRLTHDLQHESESSYNVNSRHGQPQPSQPYYNLNGRHDASAPYYNLNGRNEPPAVGHSQQQPTTRLQQQRPVTAQQILSQNTAVLQEYLQHLERQSCPVPTHVWQALGQLQSLSQPRHKQPGL